MPKNIFDMVPAIKYYRLSIKLWIIVGCQTNSMVPFFVVFLLYSTDFFNITYCSYIVNRIIACLFVISESALFSNHKYHP